MTGYVLDLRLAYTRRYSSSEHLSQPFHWNITLVDSELNTPTIVYSSSDQSTSSDKTQGPIYDFGPLSLQKVFRQQIEIEICSNLSTAFWHRHQHIVQLPYEKNFNERQIPTKARPIQMNNDLLENCKKEIEDLLIKGLIRKKQVSLELCYFLC